MSNLKMFRYEWIWEKSVAAGWFDSNRMPLRAHENILIFYDKLPTYNPQFTEGEPYEKRGLSGSKNYQMFQDGLKYCAAVNDGKRYPIDIQKFGVLLTKPKERVGHNTQKPLDLLEYLIKTYTNEGELVLDATIGSGSTAVAAINTNRHFIGFETEKRFYDIANDRITKAFAEKGQALF